MCSGDGGDDHDNDVDDDGDSFDDEDACRCSLEVDGNEVLPLHQHVPRPEITVAETHPSKAS